MISNKEKLHNALTNVDERFIAESATPPERKRTRVPIGYLVASLIALLAVSTALILSGITREPMPASDGSPLIYNADEHTVESDLQSIAFVKDKNNSRYLLVKDWNELIPLPEGFGWYGSYDVLGDKAWLVHLDQKTETMITYIFTRGSAEIESYTGQFDSKYGEPGYNVKYMKKFLNFRDDLNGSLFFCEYMGEIDRLPMEYFLITVDGGKTWQRREIDAESANALADEPNWRDDLICAEMITDTAGIIHFSYNRETLGNRIYFTNDGGRTWFRRSLPYPRIIKGVTSYYPYENPFYVFMEAEVHSLEYIDGEYILTAKGSYDGVGYTLTFSSDDLSHWRPVTGQKDYYIFDTYENLLSCLIELNKVQEDNEKYGIEESDWLYRLRIPMNGYHEYVFNYLLAVDTDSPDDLYYAFRDLNGDGSDELVIMDIKYNLRGIFTMENDNVKCTDYSPNGFRFSAIDENGNMYLSDYGNGEHTENRVAKLDKDGQFSTILCLSTSGESAEDIEYFSFWEEITKEEYDALMEPYSEYFNSGNDVTKNAGFELHWLMYGEVDK